MMRLSINSPHLTHSLFADNAIFFSNVLVQECSSLKNLLSLYFDCYGQKINLDKSGIFFGPNTPGVKFQISSVSQLSINLVNISGCLGFGSVREKVQARLGGWKSNLLSSAGKEVLIKAVVQAIPPYAMSILKFPAKFIDELNALVAKFWRGN